MMKIFVAPQNFQKNFVVCKNDVGLFLWIFLQNVHSVGDWKKSIILKSSKFPHFPASFEKKNFLSISYSFLVWYLCLPETQEKGKCENLAK